jgi:hypothetical protein
MIPLVENSFYEPKEDSLMCYNCGCGLPNDDHGKGHAGIDPNGKAITEKTFEAAANAFQQTKQESKENTEELLKKEI